MEFRGLPCEAGMRIADVYCPEVRRQPFVRGNNVNRLEVVSCWKDLSHTQAAEIALWKRLLGDALSEQLEEVIRATTVFNPIELASVRRCLLPVNLWRLVHDIITSVYSTPSYLSQVSWLVSTQDIPGMVYNFVRTHDCFRDPRANVEADIKYTPVGDAFHVVAEILWERPHVLFPNLASTLQPGDHFRIAPAKIPAIGATSGFPQFPEDTNYEVTSRVLPLKWDLIKRRFSGVVPEWNEIPDAWDAFPRGPHGVYRSFDHGPKIMEFTLMAKTTMLFPRNVRHERISRYNIKLEVRGPQSRTHSLGTHLDTNVALPRFVLNPFEYWDREAPTMSADSGVHVNAPTVDDEHRVEPLREIMVPFAMDGHYRAKALWETEPIVTLDFAPTSRGKALNDTPLYIATQERSEMSSEAVRSVVPHKRSRACEANDPGSTVMSALRKRGSVKRMVFQRRKGSQPPQLPPSPGSSVSQLTTHTVSSQDTAQREIQRNYQEFLEDSFARASPHRQGQNRVAGHDAEDEQIAFEDVFLDDLQTEDSATETDFSSVESKT